MATPAEAETEAPPEYDADDAHYRGNARDGVYFVAARGTTWWAAAWADLDTGHAVSTLFKRSGFATEAEALEHGLDAAAGWCRDNQVSYRRELARLTKRLNLGPKPAK